MQIKNIVKYHYIPIRMARIKNEKNKKTPRAGSMIQVVE
jgi:hypothetical protein